MNLPEILNRDARRAFLEERQKGIGSSDIAAVCGIDPYRDAIDVYYDKTRPVDPDDEASIHLIRGVLLEPIAAQLYTASTGRKVRKMKARQHPEYAFARANADYQILAGNGHGTGALEAKAPSMPVFNRVLEAGLPDPYIAQLQWQLLVTGYEWGAFAVVNLEHREGPLLPIEIERNETLMEQMVERADRFWQHVSTHKPLNPLEWIPAADLSIPEHDPRRVYLDPAEAEPLVRAIELDRDRKELNRLYEEAKEAAAKWMDEQGYTRTHVRGVGKLNYDHRQGRSWVNEKRLYAARPLDRDLVRGLLADYELTIDEDALSLLELDFSTVKAEAKPYRHFQCWPGASED